MKEIQQGNLQMQQECSPGKMEGERGELLIEQQEEAETKDQNKDWQGNKYENMFHANTHIGVGNFFTYFSPYFFMLCKNFRIYFW